MTINDRYQQDLQSQLIEFCPYQASAVDELQRVSDEFCQYQSDKNPIKTWMSQLGLRQESRYQGLYLWGGVGIGKTYLMDLFFHSLSTTRKLRLHFHEFMRQIHQRLSDLRKVEDPLGIIANEIADEVDMLCFDEFFVVEIGDAMILARLLEGLFSGGVMMVATSNVKPDDLYEKGLQRELFLPAIALIHTHMREHHLPIKMDYRSQKLVQTGIYFCPLNETTDVKMRQTYSHLVMGEGAHQKALWINNRSIEVLRRASQVVWFDFYTLCTVPRSQQDYLVIAQEFHTVLLSNVPKMQGEQLNLITYFIYLVDIFYDAKVKLIISAEVPIDELLTSGRKLTEFQRTQSRLREMQSEEYLQQCHSLKV